MRQSSSKEARNKRFNLCDVKCEAIKRVGKFGLSDNVNKLN
jgi:hypothetical protein